MSEAKTSPKMWATITITVSIIACVGTTLSALIGVLPDLLKITPTQTVAYTPSVTPFLPNTSNPTIFPTNTSTWTSTPEFTSTPSAYFYYDKAKDCYFNKDFDCVILFCTQSISLKPDYANAYFKRGDAYDEIGQYELAINDYTKAIELNYEPLITVYQYRGLTYLKMKEYVLSISDLDFALSVAPDANSYHNRAQAHFYLRNYEQALLDVNKAIDMEPSSSGWYVTRAGIYRKMGENEKAIADYKMAIFLNNNDTAKALAEQQLYDMGVSP